MSDILCQWLNGELQLSKRVESNSFTKDFSTGYLIGEILHKYELQSDFDQFSISRMPESKLNNFTRIEPTLHLLGIPFDLNIAEAIMKEQRGIAARLLYQLFIALQKKKKAGLTGIAMETMRPAAPAKLQAIGSEIYKERLKTIVPRETDLKLQEVSERFKAIGKGIEEKAIQVHYEEIKKMKKLQEELRLQDIEKHRLAKKKQGEIMARIQAAIVQIPKPPPNRTLEAIEARKKQKKQLEVQDVIDQITNFENLRKKLSPSISGKASLSVLQSSFQSEGVNEKEFIVENPQLYNEYIEKIRQRLEDDAVARDQREKRRRRVLVEQLKVHEIQEEAFREEQLVNRLMRQSQQERRVAVQLMHVRHEKEVIRQNRIFREKQYDEKRLQEFQEALDREAALAKRAQIEYREQLQKDLELHNRIAVERAQARYRKHYDFCLDLLFDIIDFATKTGEYRELTNNLIPAKMMREWKELFYKGIPLYDQACVDPYPTEPSPEQLIELEKIALLDIQDFMEYETMTGEWAPSEDCEVQEPPANNKILGHIINRLYEIADPPRPDTPPPQFPDFPLKWAVLGKEFAGKTTCLARLAEAHHIQILSADSLMSKAVQAFHDKEVIEIITEASENAPSIKSETTLSPLTSLGTEIAGDNTSLMSGTQSQVLHQQSAILGTEDNQPKPTVRAQLGEEAMKSLSKGRSVPDEVLIDIIVDAIRHVPEEYGWILDRFPTSINQAKLLQKALTGIDPDNPGPKQKYKMSQLLTDPAAHKDIPIVTPMFDLVILFDISDKLVLKRAVDMTYEQESAAIYQQGDIDLSNIAKGKIPSFEREQVQHKITGFQDTWTKLEKWLTSWKHVVIRINAEEDKDTVYRNVESLLYEAMKQKKEKEKQPVVEEANIEKDLKDVPTPLPTPEAPPSTTPTSDSKSSKGGQSPPTSPKDKKGKKAEKSDTPKGKGSAKKGSKAESADEDSEKGKSGKKSETPVTEEPSEPLPTESPSPKPGTDDWEFVGESLPTEVAEYLVPYWNNVNDSYVDTIKTVMRNLRNEENEIIHHLHDVRTQYQDYLKRPDHMQEFVSQWQNDYNYISDDMRDDEETKAELHQRVDDLRERLWDISDFRKKEAAEERNNIINDGWLEDHMGILVNHFSSLMQVELDRFQDTSRLLKDYYKGMEGVLPEANPEFARIPLVDLTVEDTGDLDRSKSAAGSAHSDKQTKAIDKSEADDEKKAKTKKIPLLSRKSQPSDQNGTKGKAQPVSTKNKDEQLLMDIWQTAMSSVSNMVMGEAQQREAEEAQEQLQSEERERQKASQASAAAASAKDKKKAPKSAKKKGAPSPTPHPASFPTAEQSAEELKKKRKKEKMKKEYYGALQLEEARVKSRLEVIKAKSLKVIQDLQRKSENTYKDMDDWLGARFLAEMKSIDNLTEVARHHIEKGSKIRNELALSGSEFYISGDVRVVKTPEPVPRPSSVEFSVDGSLTIRQLNSLFEQFYALAPSGFVTINSFSDILQDLTSISLGNDFLPDLWMNVSVNQIEKLISLFSQESELINWRKFLLAAAHPLSHPTDEQLLETLYKFKTIDTEQSYIITENQYKQIELWFPSKTVFEIPDDPLEPLPFDRNMKLKKFLFTLFADLEVPDPSVNYENMLLYFAADPDPVKGFHRALSLVIGKPLLTLSIVKSTQSLGQTATDKPKEGEGEGEGEGEISAEDTDVKVPMKALLKVVSHGICKTREHTRFYVQGNTDSDYYGHFCQIYRGLGYREDDEIPFSILSQHPFIQEMIEENVQYKYINMKKILQILQSERDPVLS